MFSRFVKFFKSLSKQKPTPEFPDFTLPDKIYIPYEVLFDEEKPTSYKVKVGIEAIFCHRNFGNLADFRKSCSVVEELFSNKKFQDKIDSLYNEFQELDKLGLVSKTEIEKGVILEIMASPYGEQ